MPDGELVLDLRGTPAIPLRRPQLAAFGCWMMAAAVVAPFAIGLAWVAAERAGITPPEVVIGINQFLSQALLPAAGICLIGFADIKRGLVNPWPRRLAMIALLLVAAAAIVNIGLYYAFHPSITYIVPGAAGGTYRDWRSYARVMDAWGVVMYLGSFAAWGLAMVYALQTARAVRSTALTVLSLLLLGFVVVAQPLLAAWNVFNFFDDSPSGGSSISHPVYITMWEVIPITQRMALVGYFSVCAIALHRAARRRVG